jgi:hypothetical protein
MQSFGGTIDKRIANMEASNFVVVAFLKWESWYKETAKMERSVGLSSTKRNSIHVDVKWWSTVLNL